MGDFMAIPKMSLLALDESMVVIAAGFNEAFSAGEQAVIGAYLNTLGTLISTNATYLLYLDTITTTKKEEKIMNDEEVKNLIISSVNKICEVLYKTDI